jgi:hypothetical protein
MTEPGDPAIEMAQCVLVVTTEVSDFPDWRLLDQWLAAGDRLWEDIVPIIETLVQVRRERDPTWFPYNLGCFDEAVRQARRRRVMEPPAATTDAPPIDEAAFRPRGTRGRSAFAPTDAGPRFTVAADCGRCGRSMNGSFPWTLFGVPLKSRIRIF